jgi:hypothetical protein
MQYRVTAAATVGETEDFPETSVTEGQILDSDRANPKLIDYLLSRDLIYAPNVESAEAQPGQRRTTKR